WERYWFRERSLLDLAIAHARPAGPAAPPADSAARPPRLVLLSGPAGIGKSRLLRELKHRLQLAGVRNLTGRCYEDGGVPFQPFVEVLRQLPRPPQLPPALRPILEQLVPSVRDAAGAECPAPAAERLGKQEFITGVADSLAQLAEGLRGVVFLEDLHWSDAPGVDLIDLMLRRPGMGPWLYIGSLREEEARSAPIGRLLEHHAGAPHLRHLRLEPLGVEQVTELIASMVPFADRPEGLSRLLAGRTEGNPLYLEELMQSLAEDGTLRRHAGGWIAESRTLESIRLPPSLASAVVQRVAGLPAGERAVAEVLAAFNRPAATGMLAAAAGIEGSRAVAAIEALERLRLVTLEATSAGARLAGLAHSRIREAIYKEIAADRRRALHLAVGAAIEAAHAGDLDPVVEELAHHFTSAAGGAGTDGAADDRARAADYCLRAAAKADALYYPQRQVQFLEQALEYLPPGDSARRLDALFQMTFTRANDLHDHEGALKTARVLCEEARRAGDVVHEAKGLREVSWSSGFLGDYAGALEAGRRGLALIRSQGGKHDEILSLNALGTLCARHTDHAEALAYFNEALAIAGATGDFRGRIIVLNNAAMNYLGMGDAPRALSFLEEAIATAREHAFSYTAHRYMANLGSARYESGRLQEAIRATEEAFDWSRDHFNLEVSLQCMENLGAFYSQRGLFDRGARFLEQARAACQEIGGGAGLLPVLDLLGSVHRELGRFREAKDCHREGLALARKLDSRVQEGFHLSGLANDLLHEGVLQAAEDSAREALLIGRDLKHQRICCQALCVQAQAAARRGDRKAMTVTTRALTRLDVRPLRFHERILVNLTLGRCALALGRPADAEREARAGLLAADQAGMREFQWRLNALMGDALAAKELPDDASRFYNTARDLIRQIASEIEDPAMRKDYENEETRLAVTSRSGDTGSAPPA
ncbi:MAG: tetratricopeptide repeat protein, partial [Acidobacteriota bacterium]